MKSVKVQQILRRILKYLILKSKIAYVTADMLENGVRIGGGGNFSILTGLSGEGW